MQEKSTNILGVFRTLLIGTDGDKNPHPIGWGFLSNYIKDWKNFPLDEYIIISPRVKKASKFQ